MILTINHLSIENLEKNFYEASKQGARYIGILVEMDGFNKPEVIINESDNFSDKLKYYKNTYDEKLRHKHAKGITIVGLTYGDKFEDIEHDLLGSH